MPEEKSIHAGHRDRIKKRFLEDGAEAFDDYTLLELVLFYAIPFKDTRDIALALIDRFGSVSGVLDASLEELCELKGIGDNAALLLKLIPSVCKRYIDEKTNISGECYDNIDKLGRYLVGRYMLCECERVILLLLDNSYKLISEQVICDGSVNSASISPSALAEAARRSSASAAVLAHNHPHGIALPSVDDIHTTAALMDVFDSEGIPLLEHILVAGDEYTPIIYSKLGNRRTMPTYGEV